MTVADAWSVALAVLTSLGGGGLIVASLSSWLGKVWADKLMQKDRAKHAEDLEKLRSRLEQSQRLLQAEIEKALFVSKAHFETEFKILREVWEGVSEARSAISLMRPWTGYPAVKSEKEAYFSESLERFLGTLDRLRISVDNNSPFYPEEIFVAFDKLIRIAQAERDELVHDKGDRFAPEWFNRGGVNRDLYLAQASECSKLIRQRLESLTVRGVRGD